MPDATVPETTGVDASTAPEHSDEPGVVPTGFALVTARIDPADGGDPCEVCVWLADRDELRSRGLMGVTDLGDAVGMAFVYDEPRTTSFTMRNTLVPLSIVFFDAQGRYVDAFDMEPCEGDPCPSYPTPEGFSVALEVPRGDLDALGIGPGSALAVLATACDPRSNGT